jgi:hypothetical protein
LLTVGILFVCWARGRGWRKRTLATPHVRKSLWPEDRADTVIIHMTGAFNSGKASTMYLVPFWATYGDTYVVEYDKQRFSVQSTVDAVIGNLPLHPQRYRNYVLDCSSLGGIVMFNLYDELVQCGVPESSIFVIVNQVPQCLAHMTRGQRRLMMLLRYIHPGPFLNLLLSRLAGLAIGQPDPRVKDFSDWDKKLHALHIKAIRSNKFSLVCDQAGTIDRGTVRPPGSYPRMQAVYLYTETDEIVRTGDGPGTPLGDFVAAAPRTIAIEVAAPAGHATYMEDVREWGDAKQRALDALGIAPIHG